MPYTQPTQHSHGAIPVGLEDPRCICLAICVQIRSHGHLSAECWAFSVSLNDLHWILTGICWVGSLHDGKHFFHFHFLAFQAVCLAALHSLSNYENATSCDIWKMLWTLYQPSKHLKKKKHQSATCTCIYLLVMLSRHTTRTLGE